MRKPLSELSIQIVDAGDKMRPQPRARTPPNEAGLRYDSSELYAMKSLLEGLFGKEVWYKLKETGSIQEWRKQVTRLLRAIDLSVESTVDIADDQWRVEMAELLKDGTQRVARSKYIDELLSHLAATLARIIFLQLGCIPSRYLHSGTVPLLPSYWKLNGYRSVQYVQNAKQRAAVKSAQERRAKNAKRLVKRPGGTSC